MGAFTLSLIHILLTLFNLAVQFLSEQCAATVVLCSATQPELECAAHPLREKPEEMVPRDETLWAAFHRTELIRLPDRRLEELPEWIACLLYTSRCV